jgi:3-hydroxy-3-methylglutaryl CoA synthase
MIAEPLEVLSLDPDAQVLEDVHEILLGDGAVALLVKQVEKLVFAFNA